MANTVFHGNAGFTKAFRTALAAELKISEEALNSAIGALARKGMCCMSGFSDESGYSLFGKLKESNAGNARLIVYSNPTPEQ